jgi:antitoxin CcdA
VQLLHGSEHIMSEVLDAPTKRAVNLRVSAELLDRAKAMNVNLSATLERALAEALKRKREEDWRKHHRPAIEAINKRIEREGLWNDSFRPF